MPPKLFDQVDYLKAQVANAVADMEELRSSFQAMMSEVQEQSYLLQKVSRMLGKRVDPMDIPHSGEQSEKGVSSSGEISS